MRRKSVRRIGRLLPCGMSYQHSAAQPDLFASVDRPKRHMMDDIEPPPEDFIQRIRDEVTATLEKASTAERFPWRDLTQTMLAEMRFHSITETWLPAEEAARLRSAFAAEMARLYATHDREWDEQAER